MASMKEIFPAQDYRKKYNKNFIKENIQKVKRSQFCTETKTTRSINFIEKNNKKTQKTLKSPQYCSTPIEKSIIKCNVKIFKCDKPVEKNILEKQNTMLNQINKNSKNVINQGSQTDLNPRENYETLSVTCQTCGQSVDRKNVALQRSLDENCSNSCSRIVNEDVKENAVQKNSKDSHQISHEHEEISKKEIIPPTYKKGIVPKYLKERNARLEQEQKEKEEKDKLAELQGLKDPRCPLNHMLMPMKDLQYHLDSMEKNFNSLITELNKMPVSSDSFKFKQRKIQIEKELNELESKIELFKTGKVFIKIPE